jgi:hypothetical protein
LSLCAWCKHEMLQQSSVRIYLQQISPMPGCADSPRQIMRLCVCICPRRTVHWLPRERERRVRASAKWMPAIVAPFLSMRAVFASFLRTTAVGATLSSLIERLCDREYKINLCPFDSLGLRSIFCSAAGRKRGHEFCKQPLPAGRRTVEIFSSFLPFFPPILALFERLLCVQALVAQHWEQKERTRYKVYSSWTHAQIIWGPCNVSEWGWMVYSPLRSILFNG